MALEQYKTQVLLLHSEQRTLDKLGASVSVNDKYSVHYATSGTEALNTLGVTPIHVIVSAQNLPGMSGLEALREAKKRSPDTIGILLAGSDRDDGLEALVGDKEVFQIVRGAVTPDALLNIIETATRRVRMLAISESANDTAADVDEAAPESNGEHIIMETAENGATIISDGTGRLPALKPEKIQASSDTSGRKIDVLVLTKDEEFLNTIRDSSRGLHNVHHAVTAGQAQEIVRNHKVGVLVTDAAIAGSKVQVLTQALRRDVPRLVAVVAGRRDDGELLMDLINKGQVYRFLLKPVSPGRARLAIEASVKHHLEAPDATFGAQGARGRDARATAAKPATKPATRPAPKPAAKAAPAPRPEPAPRPDEEPSRTSRRKTPVIEPIAADKAPEPAPTSFRDDSLGDQSSSKLPLIAAAAAVVLLLAGGIWFFAGGSPEESVTTTADAADEAPQTVDEPDPQSAPAVSDSAPRPAVTESAVTRSAVADRSLAPVTVPELTASGTLAEPDAPPAYASLLEDARLARDAGRIVAPAGDNAVEYYVAAHEAAPDNAAIAEELGALTEQVLAMAETALLENRAAAADTALGMIALADPDHPRLKFLTAQLDQLELRGALDGARAAIREARFEDAGRLIDRAQAIGGADSAEIDLLLEDLAAARSAQQVGDVLTLANQRLAGDRLIEPANDNARYYYELALSSDPGNTAARQGLVVIASKLVLRAREQIDAGNLGDADALLAEATALDADSSDLEASTAALEKAQERRAAAERQAAIARQEAERETLRRRAAASATLSNAPDATLAPASAGDIAAASFAPASASGDAGGSAVPEGGDDAAPAADAAGSAVPEGADSATPADGDAEAGGSNEAPFMTISELTRVNYVAPDYPRSAQRRNISGWVEISFTVTADGTVDAIEIMDSMPGSVFDDAAVEAVGKWRFEPVVENGDAVPKRAAVRLAFALE